MLLLPFPWVFISADVDFSTLVLIFRLLFSAWLLLPWLSLHVLSVLYIIAPLKLCNSLASSVYCYERSIGSRTELIFRHVRTLQREMNMCGSSNFYVDYSRCLLIVFYVCNYKFSNTNNDSVPRVNTWQVSEFHHNLFTVRRRKNSIFIRLANMLTLNRTLSRLTNLIRRYVCMCL